MQELTVAKSGELLLQTQVRRDKGGLNITIRTSSAIEDMMATMVEASPLPVTTYHRYWKAKNDLLVYGLAADLGGVKLVNGGLAYRLDRPGIGLDLPTERGNPLMSVINLSFLRLVGTSDGITFTVSQVYSRDGVADLCKKIEEATRHFYIQYLKPVDMRIMVMTQALS